MGPTALLPTLAGMTYIDLEFRDRAVVLLQRWVGTAFSAHSESLQRIPSAPSFIRLPQLLLASVSPCLSVCVCLSPLMYMFLALS